jgi:hypothetical protein
VLKSLVIPNEAFSSKKQLAILAVPRSPCLQNPLLMAVKAPSMSPAVPGRRFDAAVPGSRRVAIISGPTGGRRCRRCGALLKRRALRVRSSRSRFGSSSGTPGPGAARELQFKSHSGWNIVARKYRLALRVAATKSASRSLRTYRYLKIKCYIIRHGSTSWVLDQQPTGNTQQPVANSQRPANRKWPTGNSFSRRTCFWRS